MRFKPIEFGDVTRPLKQKPLGEVVGQPTQGRWFVIACRDKEFDLGSLEVPHLQEDDLIDSVTAQPYSELWDLIASMAASEGKIWLIGWRLRYAFEKADFTGALERGDVQLPKIKYGKNKGKHGGKLTYNNRIFEVDIVCGRRKVKCIDWANYSVDAANYVQSGNSIKIGDAVTALGDFLGTMDTIGVNVCKPTAAQLGWNHCKRGLGGHVVCVNLDAEARALERRAYHGGRNEVFRLGDIPGITHSYDVRSCYASICRDMPLPFRLVDEYRAGCTVERLIDRSEDFWFADVLIKTDTPDYPVRWHGRPIYPVGRFVTALAWPELLHSLAAGRVERVLRAARYLAVPILRSYANWYLSLKDNNRFALARWMLAPVKAMFNASLGYTAREKYDWVPWNCQIGHKFWIGTTTSPEDMSSPVAAQVLEDERRWLRVAGEPYEAMPFLHAAICSYARMLLLGIFGAADRAEIVYCDTDGILVSDTGLRNLQSVPNLIGDAPGQLTERFPPGRARVQGQKSYRLGNHFIQSGLVRTRHSALQEKQVLTVADGRVDNNGVVYPCEMTCKQISKDGGKWQNEMA